MKIFPLFKKITNVISAGVNFFKTVKPAYRLTTRATLLTSEKPAVRLASTGNLRMTERPAFNLDIVVSGTALRTQRPASRLTTVAQLLMPEKPAPKLSMAPATLKVPQKPAANIVQITFDLLHASHVVTAAQDAGGTGTWNNPTRIQGAPQGTQAGSSSFAGGLLLGTGLLRGTAMVGQPNRADLIIDRVDLDWYGETTGLPVVSDLISNLALGFRINTSPIPGTDTDRVTLTANENFFSTPKTSRIDNGAGAFVDIGGTAVTWANIALLQPYFKATTIANGLMTYYADAIRLRVTAHLVWTT